MNSVLLKKDIVRNFLDFLITVFIHNIHSQRLIAPPRKNTVINLSVRPIDNIEHQVLSLGLNFAICPSRVPLDDIISRTEQTASYLKHEGQTLREEVSRCLRMFKDPLTPTLTKDESIAFKTLKQDNSIVILKSDKGNSTVILDQVQYLEKMLSLLNSSDYIKVKRDPTTKIFTDLKSRLLQIEKQHRLTFDFKNSYATISPSNVWSTENQ